MPLTPGQTLTHYEILGPLGAGGMGEVYHARDTRLDREIAIKVLPEEMAEDEERLRRFEREAKTLASLNHTNVAGIHGVDQVEDLGEGRFHLLLSANTNTDALVAAAVEHGWGLDELVPEQQSLEDLFIELTHDSEEPAS